MANKQTVQIVAPGDVDYDLLRNMAKSRTVNRFDWDKLAEEYNKAAVGCIVVASLASIKLQNAHKTLSNRGVVDGEDYFITFATKSYGVRILENKPALITKLSDKRIKHRAEI